jgi:hypothetical protein
MLRARIKEKDQLDMLVDDPRHGVHEFIFSQRRSTKTKKTVDTMRSVEEEVVLRICPWC